MANAGTYNHTKQHFAEGSAAATPDAGEVVVYAKTDGLLYSKDDAGTETLVSGGSGGAGDITGDDAWVAKGDLIAGTTTDTAGIVTVGSNGSSLRANSGATQGIEWQKNNLAASAAPAVTNDVDEGYTVGSRWIDTTNDKEYVCLDNSDGAAVWTETTQSGGGSGLDTGSSFPGSPSTGDRYRRSDIDYLVFFYDGTRWVSEQLLCWTFRSPNLSVSATDDADHRHPVPADLDVYVVKWDIMMRAANSSTWTLNLNVEDLEDDLTNIKSKQMVFTDSLWYHYTEAIGTVIAGSGGNAANTPTHVSLGWTEDAGAQGFFGGAQVYYRYIAT